MKSPEWFEKRDVDKYLEANGYYNVKATTGENSIVPLLKEAVLGYQKAAEAGHWKAARNLANLYHQGAGDGTNVVIPYYGDVIAYYGVYCNRSME